MFVIYDNFHDLVTFTKNINFAQKLAIRYQGTYKRIR